MFPLLRRLTVCVVLIVLAACASNGGAVVPGRPLAQSAVSMRSAVVRAVPGARYKIEAFHYRIMPLRTQAKTSRPSARGLQYPDDLTNFGGPVMKSEATHNIYVNCPSNDQSCWGAPEAFERNFAGSTFAALLQQYTGTGAASFTFSESTAVTYSTYRATALYENDLFQILHQVAATLKKTGHANLYHIFLPKGTDTCFDFTTICYSPDNRATFGFCAYHGVVKFSDLGLVVFSVEPYQDIKGCLTPKSSGASEVTNSTISTLAHETFEAITDPGPKLAWYNYQGGEIGDECEFFVASVNVGGTTYNTQPMYSNKYHACATGP